MNAEKPEVVVYVSGGMVQGARGNVRVAVDVFDVDNLEAEGKTKDQIQELWEKEYETKYPIPLR